MSGINSYNYVIKARRTLRKDALGSHLTFTGGNQYLQMMQRVFIDLKVSSQKNVNGWAEVLPSKPGWTYKFSYENFECHLSCKLSK